MLACAALLALLAHGGAFAQSPPAQGAPAAGDAEEGERALERALTRESVLVLPGHNLPFVGLHTRVDELAAHHEARCLAIEEACRLAPRTTADLVPVVFRRAIDDPHQMGFAFSEALAHVNRLEREGRLRFADGRYWTVD